MIILIVTSNIYALLSKIVSDDAPNRALHTFISRVPSQKAIFFDKKFVVVISDFGTYILSIEFNHSKFSICNRFFL